MIEVKNVSKYYGSVKSLDDVSAVIEDGSIFGLIGSNGSGKSTLLRIMCGVFSADGGEVSYDGEGVFENEMAKHYAKSYELIPFAGSDNHTAADHKRLGGMKSRVPVSDERDFSEGVKNGKIVPFSLSVDEEGKTVIKDI